MLDLIIASGAQRYLAIAAALRASEYHVPGTLKVPGTLDRRSSILRVKNRFKMDLKKLAPDFLVILLAAGVLGLFAFVPESSRAAGRARPTQKQGSRAQARFRSCARTAC